MQLSSISSTSQPETNSATSSLQIDRLYPFSMRRFVLLPVVPERMTWSKVGTALCDLGMTIMEPELDEATLDAAWELRIHAIAQQVVGIDDAAFVGFGLDGVWLPLVLHAAGVANASMIFVDAVPPNYGAAADSDEDTNAVDELGSALLGDRAWDELGSVSTPFFGLDSQEEATVALAGFRESIAAVSRDLVDGREAEAERVLDRLRDLPPPLLRFALSQLKQASSAPRLQEWPTNAIAYVALTELGKTQGLEEAKSRGWACYDASNLQLNIARNPRGLAELLVQADELARQRDRVSTALTSESVATFVAWGNFLTHHLLTSIHHAFQASVGDDEGMASRLQRAAEDAGLIAPLRACEDMSAFRRAHGRLNIALGRDPNGTLLARGAFDLSQMGEATEDEGTELARRALSAISSIEEESGRHLTELMNKSIQEVGNLYGDRPVEAIRMELQRSASERGIPITNEGWSAFLDAAATAVASGALPPLPFRGVPDDGAPTQG